MIRLRYSNRTEALLAALVEQLDQGRRAGRSPLEPVHLVVPNRNMERFVELGVARALGVAANLRFHRLERFVRQWLAPAIAPARVLDRVMLEGRLLSMLLDDELMAGPELEPVARYVRGAGDDPDALDLRRVQLGMRLAAVFEEYAFSRPELLDAWSRNETRLGGEWQVTEHWQRALWRAATAEGDALPLHTALARAHEPPAEPGEVHVFGVSYVARVFQWAFAALAEHVPVHLYTLNPCMEFWEDVPSAAELRTRARLGKRSERLDADALALSERHPRVGDAADTPALVLWGRPGREHVHLLNDLTGADFEPRFVDPCARAEPTLLRRLQRDILRLEPSRPAPQPEDEASADGSVQVLACPAVRREVETVADEIWRLVRRPPADGRPPLRFNDVAVFVTGPDRDLYVPHLRAVFDEAWAIPHNVVDVPLSTQSRIAEAALLLLDLPFSRFSRPEVLDVVTHPAVRGRVPDADPSEWVRLCDRLGVFHGLDHAEHEGTYIERDVVNWDQGIKRLALGAFMTGEPSGDGRAYELGGERYLPEETADPTAAELGLLLRSLASDVRHARTARMPLSGWVQMLQGMLQGYLAPADAAEETELRRCLSALQELAERDLGDREVSYRVAAELARRALGDLTGGRGEYLSDGVVVSTLVPMRAIPFPVVFVLGLGEGRFPTTERRDTMDLRVSARRVGDVSPAERDEYTFLETLLCTRERLYLSYVARDELTGDPIEPSSVVRQLLDVVDRGHLPGARQKLLRRPPLRRWDGPEDGEGRLDTVLLEAHGEARALREGRALRPELHAAQEDRAGALAAAREALGERWEPVRELLRAVSVPQEPEPPAEPGGGAAAEAPAETLRLSLSALRKFLESPIQGWAGAVLGIEREDDEPVEAREDEPFRASGLDTTIALKDVFLGALRDGAEMDALYDETVARLEARGRWPLGPLAELRRREDLRKLAAWRRGYDAYAGETRPEVWRFGPGAEHGDADALLDPIVLELPDPRPGHAGRSLRLELTGRTEPLVRSPRGSLLLHPSPPDRPKDRERARLRYAMRGFFDALALAASGQAPGEPHEARVLFADDREDAPLRFGPVARDVARRWLADRAGELLGRTHAYWLPFDRVLARADEWDGLTPEGLLESIENERRGGSQSPARFGPVPAADGYPAPPPEEALALAHRRFDLFVELWRAGDRIPAGARS